MVYRSMEEVPLVLSVRDLIDILQVSRNTAYNIVRSNKIHSIRVEGQIRIPKGALEAYLAA